MGMKTYRIAVIATALALAPAPVLSHGGRLDRNRCHVELATGTRHCHPKKEETPWSTVGYVVGGLVIVGGIVYLIAEERRRDGGMALQLVPYFTHRGDAGLVIEYPVGRHGRLGVRTETLPSKGDDSRAMVYWRLRY